MELQDYKCSEGPVSGPEGKDQVWSRSSKTESIVGAISQIELFKINIISGIAEELDKPGHNIAQNGNVISDITEELESSGQDDS